MFVGLDAGETLGVAFGGCLVMLSIWLLYQCAIKPERENRRQHASRAIEEIHRTHWERLRRRHLPSRNRYETSASNTDQR